MRSNKTPAQRDLESAAQVRDNTAMTNGSVDGKNEFSADEVAYAQTVVQIVAPIIESLGRALGPRTEVLLHDLTKMPHSIVAITQSITGRTVGGFPMVGGSPSDLDLLTIGSSPTAEDIIGARTETDSGVIMRSSSIFFRTPAGRPVVNLCINAEINDLLRIQTYIDSLTRMSQPDINDGHDQETSATSVETLAEGILREALSSSGISVDLMKKPHKVAVVRELDRRGYFTLKESVDLVAARLGVTRFTIYNYLNEI